MIEGRGQAYRIGGDEFCVIFDGALGGEDPLLVAVHAALSERGAQYAIEPSCGLVVLPHEAADGPSAVRLADERMYAAKHETRARLNRAARNVLAQALAEHSGMPGAPITELSALARSIATGLGLPPAETAGLVDGPAAPEAPDSRAVSVAA